MRSLAIFMALLMFLTSAGLAIDVHYCQGELKSFSFYSKAQNCHALSLDDIKPSCHHSSGQVEPNKKNC